MTEIGPVDSVKELLKHPLVVNAQALELSICDAVHYRLIKPGPIFQLAELRLQQRDPERFAGFAACRTTVDENLRGSSIKDKIDACCTRKAEWLDVRQILYSTELEVWMDMSYPNPWAVDLYHSALMAGKVVSIPLSGPFTETFHTLLKEKNGFELTQAPLERDKTVRIYIGEQSYLPESHLHLVTRRRESRQHPFADHKNLGSQLAYGLLEKFIEDLSARELDDDAYYSRSLGYRLLGPLALLLIQELSRASEPVSFEGMGAAFLSTLLESLRPSWPWLPPIAERSETARAFSLDLENGGSLSTLLPIDKAIPEDLLFPAMKLFLKAGFSGSEATRIQSGAASFVRDYARMTRGLRVSLPVEPVMHYWHQRILSPRPAFIAWAAAADHFPGFSNPGGLQHAVKMLKSGPWPTATYLSAHKLARWWMRLWAGETVRRVEAAALRTE